MRVTDTRDYSKGNIMRWVLSILLGVVFSAGILGGCTSSTDPAGEGPPEVVYNPDRQFLDITIPDAFAFEVSSSRPAELQATWLLNGTSVATGNSYQYQANLVGFDTLTVQTVLDGESEERDWRITVLASPSLLPPTVPEVLIVHGEEPMDVLVSWQWISQSHFPITDYLIASSYDGPITVDNWEDATLLGSFEHQSGQAGYSAVFTAAEHGMLPGATIWFGFRGRDDHGQMSPIVEIYRHTISFAWWIEGFVYDSDHNPLPEIIIEYCSGEGCRTNTDVSGFYRVGPFLNVATVVLRTYSSNVDLVGQPFTSWFDFQTDPIGYSELGNTHDIQLLTRFETGLPEDFLTFLRQMTKTDVTTDLRPNQRLYKWEEYPIKIFIPDHVRPGDNLDFGEKCRLALDYWNLVMGEDILVEVQDPGLAQIDFYLTELPGANGMATLVAPSDYGYRLGDVIPEKISIGINNVVLPNEQRVRETAMHELGHAMGLYDHVWSETDETYLMFITSAGALDDGPLNAVHIDEKRMLEAIRYLPQGVNMAGFFLE